MSSNAPTRFCLGVLALLWSAFQPASADVFEDLEVHGFVTQGFVKTSANNFFGDSQDGSFDFREMGINASLQATPSVRLTGQLLSRRAGEMSDGSLNVDFALAEFNIFSDDESSASVSLGRIKNPLGFYNETRDVAFTRPSVFAPEVIYYEKVRNLLLSSDGVSLRAGLYFDSLNLDFSIAAGRPLLDENVEYGFLGRAYDGGFEADGLSLVARVLLESSNERFRSSISMAKTSIAFVRGNSDPLGNGVVDVYYGVGSLQFNFDPLVFTLEYLREPIRWNGFAGHIFSGLKVESEGFYVQGEWHVSDDLDLMLRYGEIFADRNDRDGRWVSQSTFGVIPGHTWYSKILSAGARWNVSDSLMLRAEYQVHSGTFVLSGRENANLSALEPAWDMFALEASYRF